MYEGGNRGGRGESGGKKGEVRRGKEGVKEC